MGFLTMLKQELLAIAALLQLVAQVEELAAP
jgi:hypothetical protein